MRPVNKDWLMIFSVSIYLNILKQELRSVKNRRVGTTDLGGSSIVSLSYFLDSVQQWLKL